MPVGSALLRRQRRKQNTFAAHNPSSFIGVVLRHARAFNLANAFEEPVIPARDRPLTMVSAEALANCQQRVARLQDDGCDTWSVLDDTGRSPADLGTTHPNLPKLLAWLQAEVDRRVRPAAGA
jgi:CRISPR system Cascade subunit CasC